ncbi:MAG: DUF58 domain-containing protein [Bdellovibrionales bacterium]|nr:DUF58 domain-containing protein [Bdellovibrionales bacterium]
MSKPSSVSLVKNDFSEEYLRNISLFYEFKILFFNKSYILLMFLFLICIIGFFKPIFLYFGISGFYIIFRQYKKLKHISENITLNRSIINHKIKSGKTLSFRYHIKNNSRYTTSSILLTDYTQYLNYKEKASTSSLPSIEKYDEIEFNLDVLCEAPTGKMNTGSIILEIQDELGLFTAINKFDNTQELQVICDEHQLNQNKLRRAKDSPLAGDIESAVVGHGISLFGLRDYREGDPLKLISWKKSTLEEKFLVKELEKDITRRVVFQISQEKESHMGYAVVSTWEISKAICLNLIRDYLDAYSSVSFITDDIQLKDLSGMHTLGLFEQAIFNINFRKSSNIHEKYTSSEYLSKVKPKYDKFEMEIIDHYMNPPCLYYYISASLNDIEEKVKFMSLLKAKGFKPVFVYISPVFPSQYVRKVFRPTFVYEDLFKQNDSFMKSKFVNSHIPFVVIDVQNAMGQLKVNYYE